MLPTVTVTDLENQKKLNFRRGDYNILDCGIRTGKTFWAINNLVKFTRDNDLRRILFLVDTNALKNNILAEYGDTCADADEHWEPRSGQWNNEEGKIGVMCYQRLGNKVLKNELDFLEEIDVICWDECDSIFDFAAQAFARARKSDFGRGSNAEILVAIQKYSTRQEYMPLVLLGQWERIVNEGRIMCIGLSATPERAYSYYRSLVSTSYKGKIEANYQAAEDIYFYNLKEHCMNLPIIPGKGYWCFSPWIKSNQALVRILNDRPGINAIEIHSDGNNEFPMTAEQKRVGECITTTGLVPMEYNFVIVNRAFLRGFTITDERFDNVIIDSFLATDRKQVPRQVFPYQRHVKAITPPIGEEYLNTWLTVTQCRELAEIMQMPELDKSNSGKVMTWNKLKDYLPTLGYTVQKQRKLIDGKQQQAYYITGQWQDATIVERDFLELVEAKEAMDMIDENGEEQGQE